MPRGERADIALRLPVADRGDDDPAWVDAHPCAPIPPPPQSSICAWDADTTRSLDEVDFSEDALATPELPGVAIELDSDDLVPLDAALGDEEEERGDERRARSTLAHGGLILLEHELDAATTDTRRVELLVQIAHLLEVDLLQPAVAIERLERALTLAPASTAVLDALVRCQQACRAWGPMTSALEARARVESDPKRAAQLWARAAEVHAAERKDLAAASRGYVEALRHRPRSRRITWALARLSEKQGDYAAAAAYHADLARLTRDPIRRAQIYCAIGELLADEDRDAAGARANFERAVALDPTRVRAWEALETYAARSGNVELAARCLERQAAHAPSARVKGALYVELGHLRHERLADPEGAFEAFDLALEADGTNEAAAAAALHTYITRREWAKAKRACDLLLLAARRDEDRAGLQALFVTASQIAQATGDGRRALFGLLASFELAPLANGLAERIVAAAHEVREQSALLEPARLALVSIAAGADDLAPDLRFQLGDLLAVLGEVDRAMSLLGDAIASAPHHEPALDRLADLAAEGGNHLLVARCRRMKAEATRDRALKKRLFLEAGDVMARELGDFGAAAEDYEAAREVAPTDSRVLHSLIRAYTELGAWREVVRVLEALAGTEVDRAKRARVMFTLGQVIEERLGDATWAATVYDGVLDLDPSRLDAFERVARLLTQVHDWDALADAYVAMVKRHERSDDVELKHALCHQLGLVYRDRLGEVGLALASFDAALALRPDDPEDRRILAELLVVLRDVPTAIEITRRSVARDPSAEAPLRELYDLFLRQRRFDMAWCVADLLAVRGRLTDEQSAFLERFPPRPLHLVPGTLTSGAWHSHLLHADLDPTLTTLFAAVAPAVRRARREARDASGEANVAPFARVPEVAARAFADGAEILGLPAPRLRPTTGLEQPFALGDDEEGGVLVSPHLCAALDVEVLAFFAGKYTAACRPDLLAHALVGSTSELGKLVRAAVRAGATSEGRAAATSSYDPMLAVHLAPEEHEALHQVVCEVLRAEPVLDVRTWAERAAVSVSRAGLLLAGSVGAAKRACGMELRSPSAPSPGALLDELTRFATSEAYAELRAALGLDIGR